MKEDRDCLLEVRNLNTFYIEEESIFTSKKRKKQVCKDVSFTIKRGEILGLLGESGSGKTTLVKAVLGITKEYTGEIALNCTQPQMIFQDPYGSLNPAKKILWILEEPLRVQKKHDSESRKKKAYEMLDDEVKNDGISYLDDDYIEEKTTVFCNLSDEANQKMQTLWTDMKSSEEQTPNKVIVPAFMSVCVIASLIILIRRYIKKKKDMF